MDLKSYSATLLGGSLTFCYIIVPPDRRLRGKSGSVSGCRVVRPAQLLTVTAAGCRMSAARRRRALSVFPKLKVANFALFLSVRRTENRINVEVKHEPWWYYVLLASPIHRAQSTYQCHKIVTYDAECQPQLLKIRTKSRKTMYRQISPT